MDTVFLYSATYLPLGKLSWRRALMLLYSNKVVALNPGTTEGITVRGYNYTYFIPNRLRLISSNMERQWKIPKVTRKAVIKRDEDTCQYCGDKKYLTIDHVIPTSRGGRNVWDNVVTACKSCNNFKADKTPEESGMKLMRKPGPPMHPMLLLANQEEV